MKPFQIIVIGLLLVVNTVGAKELAIEHCEALVTDTYNPPKHFSAQATRDDFIGGYIWYRTDRNGAILRGNVEDMHCHFDDSRRATLNGTGTWGGQENIKFHLFLFDSDSGKDFYQLWITNYLGIIYSGENFLDDGIIQVNAIGVDTE